MTAQSQSFKNTVFPNDILYAALVLLNRNVLNDMNIALAAAGCAIATTTSKAKTVNSVAYTIDGVFQTAKAGTDNFWTPTGVAFGGGPAVFTKYLLLVNAAGAASVLQSSVSPVSAAACVYPSMPDGFCVFGVLTIALTAGTVFTPGTTLLGAAGVTATFTDGTDKALLALLADASNGLEILLATNNESSGSYLG